MIKNNNILLDINDLVFQYKDISLADFSLFLSRNICSEKNTLLLLYFLILKNNSFFWKQAYDKIQSDISITNYILQLNILKTYPSLDFIISENLKNSILISNLDFTDFNIQQIFFDFSVIFTHSLDILFFHKKTNIESIICSSFPMDKYNCIKPKMTLSQKKMLLTASLKNFRISSLLILNDLFLNNPKLFTKNILYNYLNIFSQCSLSIKEHTFNFLKSSPKKDCFKLGTNLSYTSFDYDFLISLFNSLEKFNEPSFLIMACGLITNPQNNKKDVSHYLIKKIAYNELSKKLGNAKLIKGKINKI